MPILFAIYFPINFEFVLLYYTDDGSLELGSETSGLVMLCLNNWKYRRWKYRNKWNHVPYYRRVHSAIYWKITLPSK